MTGDGYDSALSAIRNNVEDLAIQVAIWEARDDGEPDAHARRAASQAIDLIDDCLAGLHQIRQQLISQIRVSDDQAAARADQLLARHRDHHLPGPSGPGTAKPGC